MNSFTLNSTCDPIMPTQPSMTSSPTDWRSEYPFPDRFLHLDGVRYHYVDLGSGDPLLFVHGNPTWSFAWRKFITDLSPDYRTIAVDHVGCGLSDKPQDYPYRLDKHIDNLCRLIDKLDLKKITLVAHDWGGAIGMGAATRLPDRFSRFVLCNTAAFRSERIPFRIALCRIPLFGPIALRGFNAFSRAALTMAVSKPRRLTPPVRAGYLAPYDNWRNRQAVLRFVQDIPLDPTHPSYAVLKQIEDNLHLFQNHPMLLMWGMQDWCFTPHFLRRFQNVFPQSETLELPDAGHYLFEDAPEQLLPRIRQFLTSHPLI